MAHNSQIDEQKVLLMYCNVWYYKIVLMFYSTCYLPVRFN